MNSNKKFAAKLLRRIKPKALILICYYGEWQQALMVAAKELGIKTFDIQHGIIYDEHYSYGKFSNIPHEGLSTLPDYFWTWSQYESSIINSWSPKSAHQAIAWGNPWLMAFKENKVPQIQDISKLFDPDKKLILYTLGNRGEQFPDYLISFIRENSKGYEFWFRLHPRQLSELDSIKKELEKLEILNLINIEEGTNQALPNILKYTSLHITLMSSVAIEAANMGVQSLILHDEGREYYKDHEIKEYCYFYTEQVMGLSELITSILNAETVNSKDGLSLAKVSRNLIDITDETIKKG